MRSAALLALALLAACCEGAKLKGA